MMAESRQQRLARQRAEARMTTTIVSPTVNEDVLAAAWTMADLLNDHSVPDDETEGLRRINNLVGPHGPQEIFRGHLLITGVLAQDLARRCVEGDDDIDPLLRLGPIVMQKMRDDYSGDVDPATLPTISAVLTAGLLGQDVLGWAETHLPRPTNAECHAMIYVAWYLGVMFDDLNGKGSASKIFGQMWGAPRQ